MIESFIRDRAVLGGSLVIPVRVAWREYQAYCTEWGFEPAGPKEFVLELWLEDGVEIREAGRGRLRRCFTGLGLLPAGRDRSAA